MKKNSEHHTSIQWNAEARAALPGARAPAPGGRTVHPACPRLVASIEAAAREGQIPIGAEDGY